MSDKKFDNKIRELLDNHEPDVRPDWGRMKERIAAAAAVGAIGIDIAGSKIISQLSIVAAVVAGAVTIWVAQQYVFPEDDAQQNSSSEQVVIVEEESDSESPTVYEESEEAVNDQNQNVLNEEDISEIDAQLSSDDKSNVIEKGSQTSVDIIHTADDVSASDSDNALPLVLPFAVSSKQACVGIEVDFSLKGSYTNMIFLWDFGDGSFSNEAHPSHIYEEEGVFDVTLSVRSPDDGAIITRTIEKLIEVHPQPDAKLNWKLPRIVTNEYLEVMLNDETEETNSSTWIVDGTVSEGGIAEFSLPGSYALTLISSNKFGCQDNASGKIELGNRTDLKAPARFSPDGDGRYDAFIPFGLYGLTDKWELVISDESGNELYATSDFNSPWNGLNTSGDLAANGSVFYWTVICTDHSGTQRLYNDVVRVER